MNNVKAFIPWLAFCLYFGIALTKPIDLSSASFLAVLAGFAFISDKAIHSKEIKEVKEALAKEVATNVLHSKEIDILKTSMASVKLSTGMRTLGNATNR